MSEWSVGEQDTVTAILARAVAARPDHSFITFPDGSLTYAEFDVRSNRLAHGLKDLGVQAGDVVTSVLDNNIDCVLTWFAVNKLGAIWVPVNTALKGEFLRHQLADATASVVIAETDYCDRIVAIEKSLPTVTQLVYRGEKPGSTPDAISLKSLQHCYSEDESVLADQNQPQDLAMLIYTSGTTGPSKGCMISHNYCGSMARLSQSSAGRSAADINWSCLPLFHLNATTTTVLAAALTQGSCYFMPRFSLSGFWPSIRQSGATVVNLIGQMVPLISKAGDTEDSKACFGQVRAVMALPFDVEQQKYWQEHFGVKIAGANCYGLTEASLMTSLRHDETAKPGSSGKRNEYFDVMVVDERDQPLPPGEPGEVVCRPRQPHIMFEGYWNNPAKTMEVWGNLWMHSGDIGKFDEDGFFYFVDRKKDYLRRGGENISSYEIEVSLSAHSDVKEVAVHSVPSELSEDEVKATIVLMEDASISEEDLCRWSVDHLPYYAVPRYIEFRDCLPVNPLNKVMKYQLRDEGVTDNTWDRNDSDIELIKR